MKYITGNLITMAKLGQFDVIAHGCNCFCAMGSGIARQIKDNFPLAWHVDSQTSPGDVKKLGKYTQATCQIDTGFVEVLNMYTQYRYGTSRVNADYDAIRSAMQTLRQEFGDRKIGMPKIGAGLAGGDWNIIEQIIMEELDGCDVTIVEWDGT